MKNLNGQGIPQHWQTAEFDTFGIEGQKVLEIGFGQGTDHLQLARKIGKDGNGGESLFGIDITPESKAITEKRFALYGYRSQLITGDAEHLPYEDNTFDFVYSFGVLHHTPDIQKAVDEVFRVLRPGGKCYIGLYNKNSIYYKQIFLIWLLKKILGKTPYTLQQRLSLIEYPNDNPNLVVKLHTENELRHIFKNFSIESVTKKHLSRNDFIFGKWLFKEHSQVLQYLAAKFGWYLIIRAVKTD